MKGDGLGAEGWADEDDEEEDSRDSSDATMKIPWLSLQVVTSGAVGHSFFPGPYRCGCVIPQELVSSATGRVPAQVDNHRS